MKDKPELNHNSKTASYGMCAKIPDQTFLNGIINMHTEALLDTL